MDKLNTITSDAIDLLKKMISIPPQAGSTIHQPLPFPRDRASHAGLADAAARRPLTVCLLASHRDGASPPEPSLLRRWAPSARAPRRRCPGRLPSENALRPPPRRQAGGLPRVGRWPRHSGRRPERARSIAGRRAPRRNRLPRARPPYCRAYSQVPRRGPRHPCRSARTARRSRLGQRRRLRAGRRRRS